MASNKSHGLMGLPHYKNSRVSTDLFEPIYQNLFVVQLTPPTALTDSVDGETTNLVLEGVRSVGGIDTTPTHGIVTQAYKDATRSFASSKAAKTYVDLNIKFDTNVLYTEDGQPSNYTIKFLRQWSDLIRDPLTGKMSLKKDYIAPNMTVTMHDRVGNPIWGWIFYNIFPTKTVNAPTLDYNSDGIYGTDVTFRSDVWDEVML